VVSVAMPCPMTGLVSPGPVTTSASVSPDLVPARSHPR
jgi:hypothetical protein